MKEFILPVCRVMVAERALVDVLAVTLAVNVFPDLPLVGETVNQDWFELTVQEGWFVVTVMLIELAAEPGDQESGLQEYTTNSA